MVECRVCEVGVIYSKDAKGTGFRRVIVRHSDSTLDICG
jgi:hypothetical protein